MVQSYLNAVYPLNVFVLFVALLDYELIELFQSPIIV